MSTAEMEQLISGASNSIIQLLKALRTSLLFVHTVFLLLLIFVFRHRCLSESLSELTTKKLKLVWRREEEGTFRLRALAEELHTGDGDCRFRRDSFLFYVHKFERSMIDAPGPCVMFAIPGMISGGFSLEVFKHWAPSEKNLVTMPRYCWARTIGHKLRFGKPTKIDLDKDT